MRVEQGRGRWPEASPLRWGGDLNHVEAPDGVFGFALGDQQGLTTVHSTIVQGNLDEHGSTGGGEAGLNDQGQFLNLYEVFLSVN